MDMAGHVVGVMLHRLNAIAMAKETGALSENVNYAVKSSHLLNFLRDTPAAVDVSAVEATAAPPTADPATIQRVKDATVLVFVESDAK